MITPTDTSPASLHSPQHLIKQLGDLGLVPAAELRDCRMIRHPHAHDHLVRHVLKTRPLDPTRRAIPARIGVQKQSHEHRRVIRSTTRPTQPIPLPEPTQIHLIHRPQTPSTPNDPQAATPPTTAASTTTDPAHTKRNLEPSRKCLKPARRHRYSDSLPRERSRHARRSCGWCCPTAAASGGADRVESWLLA